MPYRTDKIKFDCPFLDRRVKLIPCQIEMVHFWYQRGESINGIARMFNVDKRLIQFELFLERKDRNVKLRADRGGSKIYYKGGEEWNETMREHRRYKHKLLKDKK